jgi:hypothetical protein
MKATINLNDRVTVTLKEKGVDLYARYCGKKLVAGEKVELQLWCAFEVFGPHIHIGFDQPIETDIEL